MKVPMSLLRSGPLVITPFMGQSGKGAKTYGPSVDVDACRFEGKRRMVRLPGGQTVTGSGVVWVRPDVTVKPEDKAEHRGRVYEVYEVLTGEGLNAPAYFELIVGAPR